MILGQGHLSPRHFLAQRGKSRKGTRNTQNQTVILKEALRPVKGESEAMATVTFP